MDGPRRTAPPCRPGAEHKTPSSAAATARSFYLRFPRLTAALVARFSIGRSLAVTGSAGRALLSGAQAAAAIDEDALAGDEAGAVGGDKADGVRDVGGGAHTPGGHGGEV